MPCIQHVAREHKYQAGILSRCSQVYAYMDDAGPRVFFRRTTKRILHTVQNIPNNHLHVKRTWDDNSISFQGPGATVQGPSEINSICESVFIRIYPNDFWRVSHGYIVSVALRT